MNLLVDNLIKFFVLRKIMLQQLLLSLLLFTCSEANSQSSSDICELTELTIFCKYGEATTIILKK
jgi:hypothetical protein